METEAISWAMLGEILRARLDALLLPEPLTRVQERAMRQRQQIAALLRRDAGLRREAEED